jgi:SAM-dependent methyltransferase
LSDFALYFDKSLKIATPYTAANSYVIRTRDRVLEATELIRDRLKEARVADVGASPFYFLWTARQHGARECHGVFFSNEHHPLRDSEAVYSEAGDIRLHHRDIRRSPLPFHDESMDVVVSMETLEHLDEFPALLLREVHRVLRCGGCFLVTVPNVCRIGNVAKLLVGHNVYHPYRPDPSGRHAFEYTLSQATDVVGYAGLDIVHAGYLSESSAPNRGVRALYRAVARMPVVRRYAPVICVLGQKAHDCYDPEPMIPESVYREMGSTEIGLWESQTSLHSQGLPDLGSIPGP